MSCIVVVMSGYQNLIRQAINCSADVAAVVEDFMRIAHDTLDHLSPAEFNAAANEALVDVRFWSENDVNGMTLDAYCKTMGLPILVGSI